MKKQSTENHFLLRAVLRYKWKYFFGIITLFVVDFAGIFIPQFTGEITDGLQAHTMDMAGVLSVIAKIILVGLILTIGRFLWRYFIFGSARGIEYHVRNDMFSHLEKLSAGYFNEHKTGDLMAHFTNDLNTIRMATGPAVVTAFDAVVMTLMVLIKMIVYVDLRLTLLACVPLSLIAVGGAFFGKEIESRFDKKQAAFSSLSDEVQESFSGIRVIKSFVQTRKEQDAFAKSNQDNMEKNLHVVKLFSIVLPLLDLVIGISSIVALFYGGHLAITGEITLGRFIAFNQYIGMLVWPMLACGDSINYFSQGKASAKRIAAIFAEKPEIFDGPDVREDITSLQGKIRFKNLDFTYPKSEEKALGDIDITILKGETFAILGRTGSGKTTFANLLLRVYDTEPGSLFLDNTDIRKIPLKTLREQIAYVPQDNFLFSDTLEHNIAFGVTGVKEEEVIAASKDACIHDNIIQFPEGYQTMVGERGVTLSGGQKQRSSIARALLKDAPILILDDALSAVDTNTEEQILLNLKENREGKTTIIIAHRISTIQSADHILVLSDSKIAEFGTHEELIENDGIYKDMFEKQQLEKQLEEEEGDDTWQK